MTGVALRDKWITWAMFMGPVWSPSSPQGGYHKKMYTYHLDWAPWAVTKHTVRCVLLQKIAIKNFIIFVLQPVSQTSR